MYILGMAKCLGIQTIPMPYFFIFFLVKLYSSFVCTLYEWHSQDFALRGEADDLLCRGGIPIGYSISLKFSIVKAWF